MQEFKVSGFGNRGFQNVKSLYEAKELLKELEIPYEVAVQQQYGSTRDYFGRVRIDKGIHIYFMNKDKTKDYGYYTPIMQTVFINAKTREWGIQPLLIEV